MDIDKRALEVLLDLAVGVDFCDTSRFPEAKDAIYTTALALKAAGCIYTFGYPGRTLDELISAALDGQGGGIMECFKRISFTEEQRSAVKTTWEKFDAFAEDVIAGLDESREKSLAITKLQEMLFWIEAARTVAAKKAAAPAQ